MLDTLTPSSIWFSVGASGFEPPTSWSRSGDQVCRRTTKCSTHAVFWAVGVVPRELKSLRSSEKLTPKLTRRATSWTDFRRSLFLHGLGAQNIATFPPSRAVPPPRDDQALRSAEERNSSDGT